MTFITANNGTTTLGAQLTSAATSLTVFQGTGARFPTVIAPDILMLTLDDGNNVEIVKCTSHANGADVFTITRAAELYQTTGSLSYQFEATGSGTLVEARFTKAMEENWEPIRLLQQGAIPTVAAPSGTLQLYARGMAGRAMMKFMGTSGVDYIVQPGLFDSQVVIWRPGFVTTGNTSGNGTGSAIGATFNIRGTGSFTNLYPTWSGSLSGSMRRLRLTTPAQSGSYQGIMPFVPSGSGLVWRGTSAGQGGFFAFFRVAVPSSSNQLGKLMIGLSQDSSSALPYGSFGSAQAPNSILVGFHGETGSYGGYAGWAIGMAGTSSTGYTKPMMQPTSHSTGEIVDVYIHAAPFSSTVQVRVDINNSDGSITTIHDELWTGSLPVANCFMTPKVEVHASTAVAQSVDVISIYLESDY